MGMKKIYLKPEVLNTTINTEWAMCTQGGTTNETEQTQNPGFNFAPQRKVF